MSTHMLSGLHEYDVYSFKIVPMLTHLLSGLHEYDAYSFKTVLMSTQVPSGGHPLILIAVNCCPLWFVRVYPPYSFDM